VLVPVQPASEMLIAIQIPKRSAAFIASGNWTAREIGLEALPPRA
jgi:hypothetical protein